MYQISTFVDPRIRNPFIEADIQISSKSINLENTKQIDSLFEKYKSLYKDKKTVIIDSDNIKKMFSDYNPKRPELVHDISSKLSEEFFQKALKDSGNKVAFTMGGGGSGKTELIINGLKEKNVDLILDGTGKNYKKLKDRIKQAQGAGKEIQIEAVYIDYNIARKFNSKRERNVPENILRSTHSGYRESLKMLLKDFPRLEIKLILNTGKKDKRGDILSKEIPKEKIIDFLDSKNDL